MREDGKPIRISFIGNVRFFDVNEKIVDAFKNDPRFELHYHGTNAKEIEEYAKRIGANNVICSGSFPVSETKHFLEDADIINNAFGNKTVGVRTLTSIRLFHAAYMNMPILVNSGTFMQKVADKYGIGFPIEDLDEFLPDKLYKWYKSIDFNSLAKGCKDLIIEAEIANEEFEKTLSEWLL